MGMLSLYVISNMIGSIYMVELAGSLFFKILSNLSLNLKQ